MALSAGSRGALAVTLVLAAALALVMLADWEQPAPEAARLPQPQVIAEGAGAGLEPANSAPAIAASLALGVEVLQLDLVFTRDGVLVLHQGLALDPDTTRGPDGQWLAAPLPLHELLADELAGYDLGRLRPGSDAALAAPERQARDGTLLLRLGAAVALAERQSGGQARYLLTLQRDPTLAELEPSAAEAATLLAEALARLGLEGRVAVASLDWSFLLAFRAAAPTVPTVWMTSEQPGRDTVRRGEASPWLAGRDPAQHEGSLAALVLAEGGAAWAPDYRDLRPVDVAEARRLGLAVLAWGVAEPAALDSLLELEVAGIVTPRPDRLRAALAARGLDLPAAFAPLD